MFTYFFLLETMVDVVVYGALFNGPLSHLRQGMVVLEFISNIIIVMAHLLGVANLTYLNAVRALRAFTLAKLVFKTASVHSIVTSLVQSVPSILNLLVLEVIMMLAVATICVRFFRGTFYSCDTTNIPSRLLLNLAVYHQSIRTRQECIDFGGDWVNSVHNFDNVMQGMAVMFLMVTTDGWSDFMYMMVDSTGIKMVPKYENNIAWSYFTIMLIIISNFLLLNFYAGVLMDTFSNEKNKLTGLNSLSNSQKHWLDLQSFIIHQDVSSRVRKPRNPIRAKMFTFWSSKAWNIIRNVLILVSALCFWLVYHRQDPKFEQALRIVQGITYIFFFLEIFLQIVTYGTQSYRHKSLMFDLVLFLIEGVSLANPDWLDHSADLRGLHPRHGHVLH